MESLPGIEPQLELGVAVAATDELLRRARERLGAALGNKWRLDQVLGVGGMASVYAATHRNGSRAALKILHPELSSQPLFQQQFLQEGYVANSVGHRGAVRIIDDDVAEDGSLFLVTELLQGETLEERRIRLGGQLSAEEVLALTDQLLDVLAAAHCRGIVHRDLKPDNVFLTHDGQVKVLDFGIAVLRNRLGAALPQSHMMMGTPAFMAPEHAGGLEEEVDEQSDLWACGATMYTLLSGQLVHGGETANEQLVQAMMGRARPIGVVAPQVPPAVASVVDRALAFEKQDRWRNAPHMREAVRLAYDELVGVPIAKAPRLTVPVREPTGGKEDLASSVPFALVPSVPFALVSSSMSHRGAPSKAPPLVKGSALKPRKRYSRAELAGAVLTVLCICVGGAGLFATRELIAKERLRATHMPEPVAPPAIRVDLAPVEDTLPQLPSTHTTRPESHVAHVPFAGLTREPRARAIPPTTTPAAAAVEAAQPRPDCNPPYIVDGESGKKRWRLECF